MKNEEMNDLGMTGGQGYEVYLRPLRIEDAAISCRWRNDPAIWEFTCSRPDIYVTEEIEREWARKVIGDTNRRNYAVCLKAGDRYIGNAYICDIDWLSRCAEFGLVLGERGMWGKGIGIAALKLLEEKSVALGIKKVCIRARADHLKSLRLVTKSGYKVDNTVDGVIYHHKDLVSHKLLMLGSSNGSGAIVSCAHSLGIGTIVTDYNPIERSPAKQNADENWTISTGDLDALEARCREEGVTAVISGVSRFNINQGMELAGRLGFPYYCTPEARHLASDKLRFKAICKKLGAPVATDYTVSPAMTDAELDAVRLPVVVKPIDQAGNVGISYCHTREELIRGCKAARAVSNHETIIVERMLHGEEWYGMYALADGHPRLLSLCAMYSQPGEPKNCYTITTSVSNHVEDYVRDINPSIERVLREVGCTDGIAWVQVMLDEDGHFYIIEMGYRGDGELMYIPLKGVTGFDSVKWLVETALGIRHTKADLPPAQEHAFGKCACGMMLFTNKGGKIARMQGFDEMATVPGVYLDQSRFPGDEIAQYSPVGVVTFAAENCEAMCALISKVNETIHCYDEAGEDMIIKYTDFERLRQMYVEGLAGK